MQGTHIRIANQKDLDAIVRIYNQAVAAGQMTADTDPVSIEDRQRWFAEHVPEKYPVLVAVDGQEVVGYLTLSAYRPGRSALRYTAEVSYYVDFSHHRKGIASSLMNYAIKMCPALQIKNLFAILLESNQPSIQLLKSSGFKEWGCLPQVADFDGDEIGHLYYGLRLEAD